MSRFQEIQESELLKSAKPIESQGSTCLAYRIEIDGKQQFLKRLRPQYAGNPRYVAAFTKEFMLGKQLSHPNLVTYNEMNTSADGVCMLLDYVAGETLTKRLRTQPKYFTKSDNLYRFTSQLLSCLQYLHSHQVVHLDLKPDNIMLTQVDGDVKVLDLGFCYTDTYCTTTGKTDEYAAPEQQIGGVGDVDARTDLYAVGKILQKIEESQGTPLPKEYRQLMGKCLSEKKENRPLHASDCLKMIRKRHVVRWTLFSVSALLLMFLIGWVIAGGPEKLKEARLLRTPSGKVYDFLYYQVYYHILSEDSLTCEAVGWFYDDKNSVNRNPNIMIYDHALYKSKRYKVTSIDDYAFYGCVSAQSVFIPKGIRSIGECAFDSCLSVSSISIPNSVDLIESNAFRQCRQCRSIHLPEGISLLSHDCFACCNNLEGIRIPESVRKIEVDCFANDSMLTYAVLPEGLETMERGVFYNCPLLTEISFPSTLKTIGEYAFYMCTGLKDVYDYATKPQPIDDVFDRRDICVHVPKGSLDLYRKDPVWNKMKLVEMRK